MTNFGKSKLKYGIMFFLHNILLYLGLAVLLAIAFIGAEQKIIMAIGLVSEIIILLIAAIMKTKLNTIIWLLITIVSMGLNSLFVPLLIITIYTFVDETLFGFLYRKWQKEYRDLRALNLHDEDVENERRQS